MPRIGQALGSYRILDKIGEGGMGVVYRARDPQLERDVAIKVLPDTWAHDSDRLARFRREAQLLASLNHPHIAQVYSVEMTPPTGGAPVATTALIMELVEGPTLADRIAAGRLAAADAVNIARQIADLDAAHEHGIVHRDLKPANVKVREDGTVKLLDFGLAKALASGDKRQSVSESPTITSPAMTAMGIILGTAAYMSPEQARGRAADKRTDIWAFGCVLFEMLAARRPFEGEDVTDVLAAIVKSEPAWKLLPASVPAPLVNLLTRCLEKDVRLRLRDIGDARFDLSEALAPNVKRVTPSAAFGHQRPVWLAAAIIVCAVTTVAWWPRSAPTARATPTRFSFVVPEGPAGPLRHLAISPDGSVIVYATSSRFYRRSMNQMEVEPLAGTEGAALPMFSPDGRSIAYVGLNGAGMNFALKIVPAGGGSPVKLADLGERCRP